MSDLCPCARDPFASPCCAWANNERVCACADLGLSAAGGMAAPS